MQVEMQHSAADKLHVRREGRVSLRLVEIQYSRCAVDPVEQRLTCCSVLKTTSLLLLSVSCRLSQV